MATLTIKNVPDEIYASLAESARRNRRSLNNEAIVRLERAAEQNEEQERLDRVRRFRESLPKDVWLTDDILADSRAELLERPTAIVQSLGEPKKTRKRKSRSR